MKKTASKFFVIMVVFVLSLAPMQLSTAPPYVLDYETVSPFDLLAAERGVEFATNYVRTLTMLNNFVDSLPVSRTGELMFPDYFGGAYIDGDGNAVLLMVNMPVAPPVLEGRDAAYRPISAHIDQMQTSEGVAVRDVEFAYIDLWAAIHALNDLSQYAPELLEEATAYGWYLDVIGNRVVVELYDFTDETIDHFRSSVFDAPLLAFAQSDGPIIVDCNMTEINHLQETIEPLNSLETIEPLNSLVAGVGERIYIRRGGTAPVRSASIGYRATLGGARGFITAAHLRSGLQNGDTIYSQNGQRLGRIASANHIRLQGVDAAFITLDSNPEIRNTTAGVAISSHIISHFFVGQELAGTGAELGSRFGQVTSPSGGLTIPVGGVNVAINNTVVTNLAGTGGDSGGIVFCPFSGGVVGIIVGGHTSATHVSRATEINRALGSSVRR